MNTIPCKKCVHFDQQHKYQGGKRVEVWFGWCRKRSVYPAREWDRAQPFDVDVKRVAQGGGRSSPFIVDKNSTQGDCVHVVENS
jgi:hypothetical protein